MNAKEVQASRFEASDIRIQQHIQQRRYRQKSGISVLFVQVWRGLENEFASFDFRMPHSPSGHHPRATSCRATH